MSFFSSTQLFHLLQDKTSFLTQRASVLANNMAKADIPGYKREEIVTFKEYTKRPKRLPLSPTDQGSYLASPDPRLILPPPHVVQTQEPIEKSQEMIKSAQNAADLQAVTAFYKKFADMIRKVISKGGS